MDREEAINILNRNVTTFNMSDVYKFITEYLIEKNIELSRINLFIKTISEDPLFRLENAVTQCLVHSVRYFLSKYNINSVSKDNKKIYYFLV